MLTASKTVLISLQVLACISLVLANSTPTNEQAANEANSEPTITEQAVARDELTTKATTTEETPKGEDPVLFTKDDLTKLSRTQHDLKSIPLGERCELFEDRLRELFKDKPVENLMNSRQLFERAITSLAARTNPYHRPEQPYVGPLRECLEFLGDKDSLGSPAPPQRRVVVSDPDVSSKVEDIKKHPMEEVMEEFAEVKTRVIDPVSDLYPPRETKTAASGEASQEGLAGSESHHNESDSEHGDSLDQGRAEELPHRAMDADVMKGIVQEEIEKEDLERAIEDERDPVRKLELQLEREQALTKSLRQQLDENRYEIEDLLAEKAKREADAGGLDQGRFEMMKSMYEQASERERLVNAKLSEVQRQLADALSVESHEDDSDSDDSDDEDDEEKRLKNLAKMASKLQAKMPLSEPLANRCQKYYMLQKYPKRVNKKVVKMLARLNLPPAEPRSELAQALARFRSDLSASKASDKLLRELKGCQALNDRDSIQGSTSTSASFSAAAAATSAAATTATASLGPSGGRWTSDFNRYPQNFGGPHHEVHYESEPSGYYHHEVHKPSPGLPLHVVKTKSKSKASFSSGLKPATRFEVPVFGRGPSFGHQVYDW